MSNRRTYKYRYHGTPSDIECHGFFREPSRFAAMAYLQRQYKVTLHHWKRLMLYETTPEGEERLIYHKEFGDAKPRIMLPANDDSIPKQTQLPGLTPAVVKMLERSRNGWQDVSKTAEVTPPATSMLPAPAPEVSSNPFVLAKRYTLQEA